MSVSKTICYLLKTMVTSCTGLKECTVKKTVRDTLQCSGLAFLGAHRFGG